MYGHNEVIEREVGLLGETYRGLFYGQPGPMTSLRWLTLVGGVLKVIHPYLKELTLDQLGDLEIPVMSGQKRKIRDLLPGNLSDDLHMLKKISMWRGLFFLIYPSGERWKTFKAKHGGREGVIIFWLAMDGRLHEIDFLQGRGDKVVTDNVLCDAEEVRMNQLIDDLASPRSFLADFLLKFGDLVARRQTLLDKVKEAQTNLQHLVAIADSFQS